MAEDLLPPERYLALGEDGRVVVHVDVDCFYAQAEEVRDPSLRSKPLGVTQKYLVVTCNYVSSSHCGAVSRVHAAAAPGGAED